MAVGATVINRLLTAGVFFRAWIDAYTKYINYIRCTFTVYGEKFVWASYRKPDSSVRLKAISKNLETLPFCFCFFVVVIYRETSTYIGVIHECEYNVLDGFLRYPLRLLFPSRTFIQLITAAIFIHYKGASRLLRNNGLTQ